MKKECCKKNGSAQKWRPNDPNSKEKRLTHAWSFDVDQIMITYSTYGSNHEDPIHDPLALKTNGKLTCFYFKLN